MNKCILIVIMSLLVVGCYSVSTEEHVLPRRATKIVDMGNGWSSFELEGQCFLYHNEVAPYRTWEAITKIDCYER